MTSVPLFRYSYGCSEIATKTTLSNFFDFRLKKFVPIEGLTCQGKKCGYLESRGLDWLVFRIAFLTSSYIAVGYLLHKKYGAQPLKWSSYRAIYFFGGYYAVLMLYIHNQSIANGSNDNYVTESQDFIIRAKAALESKVQVTEEMRTLLREVARMPHASARAPSVPGVSRLHWLSRFIFCADAFPNVIFKKSISRIIDSDDSATTYPIHCGDRFSNMVVAQALCTKHNFTHLVVPGARQVQIAGTTFVIEERLEVNSNPFMQEHYFIQYEDRLTETIRELWNLIRLMDVRYIDYGNNPILGAPQTTSGALQIALIDLENVGHHSFMGALAHEPFKRGGLMGRVSRTQAKTLLKYAQEQDSPQLMEAVRESYQRRIQELDVDRFYRRHTITDPYQLIKNNLLPPRDPSLACENGYVGAKMVLKILNDMLTKRRAEKSQAPPLMHQVRRIDCTIEIKSVTLPACNCSRCRPVSSPSYYTDLISPYAEDLSKVQQTYGTACTALQILVEQEKIYGFQLRWATDTHFYFSIQA